MGKQLYVVYETDQWHSISSRQCMGMFTSKKMAINAIVKNHNIRIGDLLDAEDKTAPKNWKEKEARRILRAELELMFQTQGHSVNYCIEIQESNQWIGGI